MQASRCCGAACRDTSHGRCTGQPGICAGLEALQAGVAVKPAARGVTMEPPSSRLHTNMGLLQSVGQGQQRLVA